MSVNVNRNVSDQFYRYKMPRLIAKVVIDPKILCYGLQLKIGSLRM